MNKIQKDFILKAIWNISILYDFDISNEEFIKSYGIEKSILIKETNELSFILRG